MAQDELLNKALKAAVAGSPKKSNKKTAAPKSAVSDILAGASKYKAPANQSEGSGNFFDTPVIKQLIDAISVGTYTAGNMSNNILDSQKNIKEGKAGVTDFMTAAGGPAASALAIGQGLLGAFGGQDEFKKTQAPAISKAQEFHGIDPTSEESRAVAGIGGFIGDVVFDPTNVIGLGVPAAALRGAVRGSKFAKGELALQAKVGSEAAGSTVPTTRWAAAKQEAAVEVAKYRKVNAEAAQAKQGAKELKKTGNNDYKKADFLIENVKVLKPSVYKALVKTMDEPAILLDKITKQAPTDDIAEAMVKLDPDIPDLPPLVEPRLSTFKPSTMEEKLFDTLGQFRTNNKKPAYTQQVADNVNALIAAKGWDKIKAADLTTLGVRPEHLSTIKAGNPINEIVDITSVGKLDAIARDISNGTIPQKALAPFYEIVGSQEPKLIAAFIRKTAATDKFKEAASKLSEFGTLRTGGTPLPYLGISGHGKLSVPGKGFTPEDILTAKTAADPEQARKYLNAVYDFHAETIARNVDGAKWRVAADDIYKKAVDNQFPAFRIGEVTKAVREMKYNSRTKFDEAWMNILADVDNKLRLNGMDPRLTDMKIVGDKVIVRLAPSDVFASMLPSQRIKYIHGNKPHSGTSLTEYLPTTIMDLAEVLIRSATKLTPDGKIDFESLGNNALQVLNGKYSAGPRATTKNLDVFTYNKNNQEILNALDKKLGTSFNSQYRAAMSAADKEAVMSVAKASSPEDFRVISSKRLDATTLEIYNHFTKGMKQGKPSILSDLINKNMRNASAFGASVARIIGEDTAVHLKNLTNTFDEARLSDHLEALASKIDSTVKDPSVSRILDDNRMLTNATFANAEEVRHAEALKAGRNAFQKDTQLMDELDGPIDAINTEKAFDLSIREANRDMLYRMFGTQRFFNKKAGLAHTFDDVTGSSHAANIIQTDVHAVIRNWRSQGITSEQLRVGMKALQEGRPGDAVSAQIENVMNTIFDPGKFNFLERNTVGPEHFNRILESVGFDKMFKVNENADAAEMINTWRTWDINNVEDFLSKLTRAVTKTAEDVSMGANISAHFGSDIPQKGWVKVADEKVGTKAGNPLFPLIDQTKYYPQEIVNEFVHIGRLMTEARSFRPGSVTHTFVTKIMDPVISSLKMTQTTLKPGHHVMSIIGDSWRNNLALSTIGMTNPYRQTKLYGESYRIIKEAVGEIEELSAFEKLGRTQKITGNLDIGAPSTSKSGFEYYQNIAGGGKITHANMYALMQAYGAALPAHLGGMAEDFLADSALEVTKNTGHAVLDKIGNAVSAGTSRFDRLFNPLKPKFGAKQPYSINKFTANRDSWTRGALFLGAMRSRNFKTIEQAAEYAGNFVKKWAPTALDFGAAEAKYARRMIFYYTWQRGMVPRIIEGALMRPGIAITPNKAMYNLAYANGIDLNSIGDPFPEGTLFPSWYAERVIGPQFKAGIGARPDDLWGANPTGPVGDIFNALGSNVKPQDFASPEAYTKTAGTFLNMSTPWFKVPAEITLGHTLETDIPITDNLQYLQDMIGPARTVSRITGKDLYAGLPNRTEAKYRQGMTPEQTKENAIPELLNWATGLQFTNYTSEAAQRSAQFQQREALSNQRKLDERTK